MKIPTTKDIKNTVGYYNLYANLKERRAIDKAFQNEDAKVILKFSFRWKCRVEAVSADTDLRLNRLFRAKAVCTGVNNRKDY